MATRRAQNQKLALRADSGLSVGQFYPLASTRTILGRNLEADVPVDDTKVSRQHAAIDQRNGFYMLADLGSTNGTYLNGRRVEQACFLNAGDRVRLGSTTFVVELREKARQAMHKSWREPTMVLQGALNERNAAMNVADAPMPTTLSVKTTKRKAAAGKAAVSAGAAKAAAVAQTATNSGVAGVNSAVMASSEGIDRSALAKLKRKVTTARAKKHVELSDDVHVSSSFANPSARPGMPAAPAHHAKVHAKVASHSQGAVHAKSAMHAKPGVNFGMKKHRTEAPFEKFFVSVAELDLPNRVRRLGDLSERQVVYGRWIAAATCVGLTIAAIATRL